MEIIMGGTEPKKDVTKQSGLRQRVKTFFNKFSSDNEPGLTKDGYVNGVPGKLHLDWQGNLVKFEPFDINKP